MPTFQELLARSGAERESGYDVTGARLTKQVAEEKFDIERFINMITGTGQEAESKDVSRKRRRSGWRLGGSIAGGLLGLALGGIGGGAKGKQWGTALGAGLGSLFGSKYAQSTQPGGWKLKGLGDIPSLLSSGMFFRGGRESAELKKADLTRMLAEADKTYEQEAYTSALTDALSGYGYASLKPGDWFTDPEGIYKGRTVRPGTYEMT